MKVKIIHNPLKKWTKRTSSEVKELLKGSHKIVEKGADATICVGGDGTIFYANHQKRLEGVILGIGSKSSYICQLRQDNWRTKLLKKLKESKTDNIPILEYHIGRKKGTAVNDAVVHTKDYRVIGISVEADGKKSSFDGDGLIVSSGIGASCYAYSAGGKMNPPRSQKIQAVPIAPYRRKFKPMVLRSSFIKIKAGRDSAFIIDGIYVKELKKGETVRIKRNGHLRFFKGVGWYE